MLIAYRTEVKPTDEQKRIIDRTIGVARFIKNKYIAHNQEVYKYGGDFVSANTFSKWLNNTFIPLNPKFSWIKEVYAKSTKQVLLNTQKAFLDYFNGEKGRPRFAKKKEQQTKMYFVKNDKNISLNAKDIVLKSRL